MGRRRTYPTLPALVGLTAFSLVVTVLPAAAGPLSGAESATLARPTQITPGDLGEDAMDGLQYADPVENLDLIAPPEVDQQGGAGLSHPLTVPAGRADLAPDLQLAYDSGGGNGWVGVGWDLSLGAVEVDTRWGAPLFCPRSEGPTCDNVESETYLLDGEVLAPTAVRSAFQPRVADRDDWTRRTETVWERIIRHGSSPTDYWWEVTQKDGTTRYYGGTPEGERDPGAILTDAEGNAVRWGLSAVRDISSNVMRISYDKPDGVGVGADDTTLGSGFYLRCLTYTGSLASGAPDDPAYEVVFRRDGDLGSTPDRRPDVIVDASSGALVTTSDLLRRIEVRHRDSEACAADRDSNSLVKAWDLKYLEEAPFGKSLLRRVIQRDAENVKVGKHTFDYYDEVDFDSGSYEGFDSGTDWDTAGTASNDLSQTLLGPVGLSALGASETNSGDVHAYIGFNPTAPSKLGSFGGAITVNGGGTGGLIEMMDINGDLLPDKVFRENITGAPVKYRLNTSGPDGGTTFGEARNVLGDKVTTLSTEASVGVAGGPEAHFGVSAQFSVAADVSIGEAYFTDVNNDGLPDFVSAGTVYFNSLNEDGEPEFRDDSAGTAVPIDDGTVDLPDLEEFDDFEQLQRDQSPLQDVVRRWSAPFAGTIDIVGAVTLEPPSGDDYDGDGVRVAIQRGNAELWAANLVTPGASASPSGVTGISVKKGQAVYFRVGSIDDGVDDRVSWDPTITYTSLGSPALDQNGLSQTVYDASDDFTLAGRPDTQTAVPLEGTVRLEGTLTKSRVTSDDVTLVVTRNGTAVVEQPIARDFVGDVPVSQDIDVEAPSGTDADQLIVRLAADSPIDVTALAWNPRLYYLDAVDGTGTPVQTEDPETGEPIIDLAIPYDIDTYPQTDLSAPVEPWSSDLGRAVTVHAEMSAVDARGRAVLTVKQAPETPGQPATLVATQDFSLSGPDPLTAGAVDLDVTLEDGADYWFDLTVRDPVLSDAVVESSVQLRWEQGGEEKTRDVPSTRYSAGAQGIFPIAHRGWAYAGYNAEGRASDPIDQSAFEFQRDDYPTSEPTGFDDAGYQDPAQGAAYSFVPAVRDTIDPQTGAVMARTAQWRGLKDNLAGGADHISSARTASDRLGVDAAGAPGGGARATRRVGVTAPVFGLVAGIGPLSGSFAAGPSFGLLDYTDLNGDGFPDVVAPGSIQYTGPRGGYLPGFGSGPDVVGQDTTFAVGGGFNGSALDIKANSKGDANTAQDTASTSGTSKKPTSTGSAQQGEQASGDEYGASVGGALGISAQFTNPGSLDSDWNDGLSATSLDTDAPLERELADVNGDGLPDSVVASLDGVSVYFNLGYGFSSTPVKWSGGAFENGESYSGSVGPLLGFSWNNKEFSGGLSYNEAVDQARYTWVDVDGDGVLDRVHKVGEGTKVAFGSGGGLLPEVPYGEMADGVLELVGDIPLGQQVAQDRSRGFGGGFDFTISIGPLCFPTPLCYIIVNPGAHYERSLSSTQVQLTDVNGDGYPDSVASTEDGQMSVRLNNRGRTNLLKSVRNPIGGEIRLGYERDGNTTEQPYPLWLLARVEVDDGRPGDGPDVQLSTFEYEGNEFDSLERELMGYSSITEHQREFADDGDPSDDPILRTTVREYRNSTVFDSGLLTSQTLKDDSTTLGRTEFEWTLVDEQGEPAPVGDPDPGSIEALALLSQSRGVVRTGVTQRWYDASGTERKSLPLVFEHDALGNVVRQVDPGEPGTDADDLVSETTYSQCTDSTWVSVPATLTITDGSGKVLRARDGSPDLCLNAVPIRIEERIDDDTLAVTEMTFDAWGNYDSITYPENAEGERYRVDYVYDDDRHTDVARVTDSHGLTATAAFSPGGRVTERVDPNGNATQYGYDAFGRLETIRGPYEQDPGDPPTVSFEYRPDADGYGYAVARHHDAFRSGDTIDTAAFVDGIGRVTQTKHDADIVDPDGDTAAPASPRMIVAGAVEYDALGREVKEWFPITEELGTLGTYQSSVSPSEPTVTKYDLLDRVERLTEANGAVTRWTYGFGDPDGSGSVKDVFTTTVTDAEGKDTRTYTDVRDNVLVVDDLPSSAPRLRTRYDYDPLGQVARVVDNAGNATTHAYDGLGRRLSTQTPDGGLREMTVDPAGNVVAEVTPNLRARGEAIAYDYEYDRLTAIDYPDGTPDVAYTYGAPDAGGNGAGRVVAIEDGARSQAVAYDPLGNVARETTTMKVHNLNPQTRSKVTYTTAFSYDSFSRLDSLTYPDGEVLSHEYDSGGLLSGLQGAKACTELGALVGAIDEAQTTLTVAEVAADAPAVPFTVRIGGEQLRVTARVAGALDGQWVYTVDRGINGTPLEPTAAAHPSGATLTSDLPLVCEYRYLDRLEYDEFLDRRLQRAGAGVLTTWSFDLVGRLERQVTETPDREVQDLVYTYDQVGNVLTYANEVPDGVPSRHVSPTRQEYEYDPYYRLVSATGSADVPPGKVRTFTWDVEYGEHGNVVRKAQTDELGKANGKGKKLVQKPTTYTLDPMQYEGSGPHQLTAANARTYSWDDNGNMTGWVDPAIQDSRTITWDAEDRMVEVDDSAATTEYTYDDGGTLALERGPDGERSIVNRWYTVRNGSVPWKTVWAGDTRLAIKRSFDDDHEHQQYTVHQDLQGSTHVVTDDRGRVFQHWEYFPGGEPWIREDSTVFRTPHMYGGGYLDEVRDLLNLGARWYEPREGVFLSADPLLASTPTAAVDDPALLPAYSYAESSPIRLVDPSGAASAAAGAQLRASGVASSAARLRQAAQQAAYDADLARSSRLWKALVRFAGTDKAKKLQKFSERFDAKPLVEVNLVKTSKGWAVQDVKLSPFGFVQPTVYRGTSDRAGPAGDGNAPAPGLGGPAPGLGGPAPGAGTAAQSTGPASVAAGSTGPATGSTQPAASAPTGASASSSSSAAGGSGVGQASGPPPSSAS
jgi:RHS repeat-associated protein